MMKIMFDSNVFDQLPDFIGTIKNSTQDQYEYLITTSQIEELCDIPDDKKGEKQIY